MAGGGDSTVVAYCLYMLAICMKKQRDHHTVFVT